MNDPDESFNLKKSLEVEVKEVTKSLEVARMEGDFEKYNVLTKSMKNLMNVYWMTIGGE